MGLSPQEVTRFLHAWVGGDRAARDRLIAVACDEPHFSTHICMIREHPSHTPQSSTLAYEVYLRFVNAGQIDWMNRAHFFKTGDAHRILRKPVSVPGFRF